MQSGGQKPSLDPYTQDSPSGSAIDAQAGSYRLALHA